MKFELNRLTDYSDEAIIREIQRVAAALDISPLTQAAFNKESKVNSCTVVERFGSWKNALEKTGLENLWSGGTNRTNIYSEEELIAELRRVAVLLGNQTVTKEEFNDHGKISSTTIKSRFGSWSKALKRAELEISDRGKRYTENDYWENLLLVWSHYGRQPAFGEMSKSPSIITAKSYAAKWGTWRKALLAFIEYANSDDKIVAAEAPSEPLSQNEKINAPFQELPRKERVRLSPKISSEDRREISLRLRFKVLHRDHFKCVLCGNNPPASPGLILHVDHITPWSKGGKTQIDNLRTLCAPCNIGRGNRYET